MMNIPTFPAHESSRRAERTSRSSALGWRRAVPAATLALTAALTASAYDAPSPDPNNAKARQIMAHTANGQALAKYGYTDINISGNDISGNVTRFGSGWCSDASKACHGYAEYIHFDVNGGVLKREWVDGEGKYGCNVSGTLEQTFDGLTSSQQLAVLEVADSAATVNAGKTAEAQNRPDNFSVHYDQLVWSCFHKGF